MKMTARQLVAEARRNRTETRPAAALDAQSLRETLTAILDIVLDSCEYEREPTSRPAVIARCLAAVVGSLGDSGPTFGGESDALSDFPCIALAATQGRGSA